MTTGKATIAAQELYQASRQYGPNAEAMLAAYEPGQDPKRFASGFQNAYILGTQGNQAALQNSKAAAYLTLEQKKNAFHLGENSRNGKNADSGERDETFDKNKLEIENNWGTINRQKIGLQFFARIPEAKLTAYALNPEKSPDKARAFKEALGYDMSNYADLLQNVMEHIDEDKFVEKDDRGYGMRYEYIMELEGPNGRKANVLTGWIQDKDEKRLTSIYVTDKKVIK